MQKFIFIISISLIWACTPSNDIPDLTDEEPVSSNGFELAGHINPEVAGFEIQRICDGEGEWLSMELDPLGRFLISPRRGVLTRIEILDFENGRIAIDTLDIGVTDAQGMLYAYHSLYMMGSGEEGRGIYRMMDTTGQGDFGPPVYLKNFVKNGDHSGHDFLVGPDSLIYFLSGNENILDSEDEEFEWVTRNWHKDQLMPMDAGWGARYKAPGGFVVRFTPDGQRFQLVCGGLRNPYDFTFNEDGELFTFDSDMEYEFNLPWYRATRINHLVSGGDYAWRQGTGKRFDYYPDVWPCVVELGRSSPTGLLFGHELKFPPKYQKALFAGDWSYGRIFMVELEESGSTYSGRHEVFASGKPLNVTDMIKGPDSALYFVTGGNGTGTALYRVGYHGREDTKTVEKQTDSQHDELRKLRRHLETYHFEPPENAIDTAWQYLDHPDEFIRQAARVIIEKFPVSSYREKVFNAKGSYRPMLSLLSLIRNGGKRDFLPILNSLQSWQYDTLNTSDRLSYLRICALLFTRIKNPNREQASRLYEKLSVHFPSQNPDEYQELVRVLSYLCLYHPDGTPFIEQVIQDMETTKDVPRFVHNIWCLRKIKSGWTEPLSAAYFHWLDYAPQALSGGSLFGYILEETAREHLALWSDNQIKQIQAIQGPFNPEASGPVVWTPPPARSTIDQSLQFVKNWQVSDLEYTLELVNSPRNKRLRDFENGKKMFRQGLCHNCHYINGQGGNFGPELDAAQYSFSAKDFLISIISPSQAINSRYSATEFTLKDGSSKRGRIKKETKNQYVIQYNENPENVDSIPKRSVKSTKMSEISEMPPALLNTMTEEDILDLLYYLGKGGKHITEEASVRIVPERRVAQMGQNVYCEIIGYHPDAQLNFKLDDQDWSPYKSPLLIKENAVIQAMAILPQDTASDKLSVHFVDTSLHGVQYAYYQGTWTKLPNFNKIKPTHKGWKGRISLDGVVRRQDHFAMVFKTNLHIEDPGDYQFYLKADDGGVLRINNRLVVNNDGRKGLTEKSGSIYLAAGDYPLQVEYLEAYGWQYLELLWSSDKLAKQEIPANLFFKKSQILNQ